MLALRRILLIVLTAIFPICAEEHSDPFAPCAPATVQAIYQMIVDMHDVCSHFQIPYWIDSGTLLGAVRHRGMIPWDDDVDLCIFEKDEQRFLQLVPLIRAMGYGIVGMPFGYKLWPIDGAPIEARPWRHPYCDIFIMCTQGNEAFYKMYSPKEMKQNLSITIDDILPLRFYFFGPMTVMGPKNPRTYLTAWYGENCLTTAYRDYNHHTESAVKKSIKLLESADCTPALPGEPLQHRLPLLVEQWPADFADRYPHLRTMQ